MKIPVILVLVIMILSVIVAGCTTQQQPVAPPETIMPVPATPVTAVPSLPQDLAGNWDLTTMGIQGGTAILVPTTEMTLVFMPDGSMSGYDGCNSYSASYTLTGTTTMYGSGITFGPIGVTKKNCATLAEQATTYYDILGKTTAYVVDGTQLTLTASTNNELIYQRPSTLVTPAEVPQPYS